MFELIRENQLNLMLVLCGACGILTLLLLNTRFLAKSRKIILIVMELIAFFLLWFDRLAYVYAGDPSHKGYLMVRVSNFVVFFLTSAVVFGFNMYLADLLRYDADINVIPTRLKVAGAVSAFGMVLAVIAAFTNLYYSFDQTNHYHRESGFLIAYIIPVLCPIIQYTVVRQYGKSFSKLIYSSLVLYIFVPIACGILQIFTYGISIVNMAMVAVSISLYIFTYLDLNNTVEHAHQVEIEHMQGEHKRMQRLFDQTATAFVNAVEIRDEYAKGNSVKVAEYAARLAKHIGKSEEDCEKVYYAALLHDVGLIGVPDSVIGSNEDPEVKYPDEMKQGPILGQQILSSITEYPYLADGARYSHEYFNGTGYPEGLKGDDIPEIAKIIVIADYYVNMITKKRYRDASPRFVAREAFVREAGDKFDPVLAEMMVRIIDEDSNANPEEKVFEIDPEVSCKEYRENITRGISVEGDIIRIGFDYISTAKEGEFSAPSIVLFDSYDGRTHGEIKSIGEYHYIEYGELWFDRHSVTTAARRIVEKDVEVKEQLKGTKGVRYEITAGRSDDHLRLVMRSNDYAKEVVVALPSGSKKAYIGLTGEHCQLLNITLEPTGETLGIGDIPRIVDSISYIDHLESDIKNIQIDRSRSAFTEGIEIDEKLRLDFHTMTLPGADLIWHCPYVILFSSADGLVGGENYHEYQVIKLNGEDEGDKEFSRNTFVLKRTPDFQGWERWKEVNKSGLECTITLDRKGDHVVMKTENLGISIENTTTILEKDVKVYVALTGDQVALTDIRIHN